MWTIIAVGIKYLGKRNASNPVVNSLSRSHDYYPCRQLSLGQVFNSVCVNIPRWVLEIRLFWGQRSKLKVTSHKNIADVVFALLWVLASSGFRIAYQRRNVRPWIALQQQFENRISSLTPMRWTLSISDIQPYYGCRRQGHYILPL